MTAPNPVDPGHPPRPPDGLPHGGRSAFAWTVVTGILLIALVLLVAPESGLRARIALAAIGVLTIMVAVLRPRGFWEIGSIKAWRAVIGDLPVILIYILIGLALVIWGFVAPLE